MTMTLRKLTRRRVGPFEVVRLTLRAHIFPRHSHDQFGFNLNLTGTEQVEQQGTVFELGKSDIGLVNVDEIQSSRSSDEIWDFASVYFDRDYRQHTVPWRFDRMRLSSSRMADDMRLVLEAALVAGQPDEAIRKMLDSLLDRMLDKAGITGASPTLVTDPGLANVERVLFDEMSETPALTELARGLNMSAPALIRRFKQRHGITPGEWEYDRRVRRALRLIGRGMPLAQVAAQVGFCDQSHLNRRFKAAIGVPPAAWVKSGISSNTREQG